MGLVISICFFLGWNRAGPMIILTKKAALRDWCLELELKSILNPRLLRLQTALPSCANFWALGEWRRIDSKLVSTNHWLQPALLESMIGWNQHGVIAWRRLQAPKNPQDSSYSVSATDFLTLSPFVRISAFAQPSLYECSLLNPPNTSKVKK